ncbi:hypothetical protein CHU98_g5235 [Xylaria longipes]|nr:hypothetical protein CHU98_g5235 [Xylaria longipes]
MTATTKTRTTAIYNSIILPIRMSERQNPGFPTIPIQTPQCDSPGVVAGAGDVPSAFRLHGSTGLSKTE